MATPVPHNPHDQRRLTPAVQLLLGINVAILFLQWTLISDADVFAALGFQDASLQRTVWSALTYMFVHYGLWHLALNMYALVAFGPRLESAMGTRAFALYYIWCGLGGAVAHMLFVRTGTLVGATAAVLGVLFAFAQQWPSERLTLVGGVTVRAWVVVVTFAVATIVLGMSEAATAGGDRLLYLAHLGGLAFGWLYFRTPPAASIERLRQRISPAPDEQNEVPPRAIPRTTSRQRVQRDEVDEVVAKSNAVAAPPRSTVRALLGSTRTSGEFRTAELNRVLDKISAAGLDSLTSDERALLDRMAKRLRGEH